MVENWKKKLNDVSFGGMLLVIYFSVTLFLVDSLEKSQGVNPRMYWIILIISIFWILCLGINIISSCILDDEKKRVKK